ncbi:MAG TPA: DedA family protein [Anaerolineales bacterium]|nr:DedA family protein [Anaerolineales bacterium]
MSTLLETLRIWIENIIRTLGYPGISLVMFLECVFPPIPSELIMPFAGFLAGRGEMHIVWVILAGTLGSLIGALLLYWVGKWFEDHLLLQFIRRYGKWLLLSEEDWLRALHVFDKYGLACVFFGRLMPVIRSLISIPAGMDHLPIGKFLLFTTLGTMIWNTALGVGGLLLGENWETIMVYVERYERPVLAFAVVVALIIGWQYVLLAKKKLTQNSNRTGA